MYLGYKIAATDDDISLNFMCCWIYTNLNSDIDYVIRRSGIYSKINPSVSAVFQWIDSKCIVSEYKIGMEGSIYVSIIIWKIAYDCYCLWYDTYFVFRECHIYSGLHVQWFPY